MTATSHHVFVTSQLDQRCSLALPSWHRSGLSVGTVLPCFALLGTFSLLWWPALCPPHMQSPRPGSIVHSQLLSFSLECTSPREMTAAKKQHAPVLQAAKSDYNVQNRFPEGRYINFLNYYRLSLRANYRKISFQNTVKNYNLVYRLLCYIFL